ncbi:unnamed protein product [Hermetia illucens]|uniref:Uncharacterized protein n=1 Tax=Hermetia illucens TaxID=343691 RepID=A0A7R8UJF0_HERIL|nr:spidroin-2-like [Hermetia illucens]CAD7081642.1 unnamed protein product [Hermetia illucens]
MKSFILGLAVVALASADVSHLDTVRDADGYHYKQPSPGSGGFTDGFGQLGAGRPQQQYLPPTNQISPAQPGSQYTAPGQQFPGQGPNGQPSFGARPQGPGFRGSPQPSQLYNAPNQPHGSGPASSPQFGSGQSPQFGAGPSPQFPGQGPSGNAPQQQYLPPGGDLTGPAPGGHGPAPGSHGPAPGSQGPAPGGHGPAGHGPGPLGQGPSGENPQQQYPSPVGGPTGRAPGGPGSFGPSGSSPFQSSGSLAGGRHPNPQNQYIPPAISNDVEPAHTLSEDGYRYKNPNLQ